MRTAVIHAWRAGGDLAERVWNSWNRLHQEADLFLLGYPRPVSQISLHAVGRPPRTIRCLNANSGTALLGGYDQVWATSAEALQLVHTSEATKIHCYLGHAPTNHGPWGASTQLLAASESIVASLPADVARRACVVPPPVATAFFRPSPLPREPHYLVVCRNGQTENLSVVIEACGRAGREVLISGWEGANRPAAPHAHFLGCRPEEMLREAYRLCRALIVPDAVDFDPAMIEAQACGTPVIALRGPCEPLLIDAESNGQGTGIFFPEPTVEHLLSALEEFERRPHLYSPTLAWTQAARFSTAHFERRCRQLAAAAPETTTAGRRRSAAA